MTAQAAAHAMAIEVDEPAEIAVGAAFALSVRLSCPAGCDVSGAPIEITGPEGVVVTCAPAAGVRHVTVNAPLQVGEHVWRLACAAHASASPQVGGFRR